VLEAPEVGFPSANFKVKIVSAISLSEGGLRAVAWCFWVLLRKSPEGLQDDNQAARQEISPHIYEGIHTAL
jgi:hypothetical protein